MFGIFDIESIAGYEILAKIYGSLGPQQSAEPKQETRTAWSQPTEFKGHVPSGRVAAQCKAALLELGVSLGWDVEVRSL